ncbi:hypothetical protein JVU11DRAFT_3938 [Chiua virens]|nr:hypothetical protein JVU11DRAFT_3938 [Chiua virens]
MVGDIRVEREKIQKTLINIALASKRLQTVIARPDSKLGLQAVSARTRLDKIVTASGAILAKFLENDTSLDPGLEDWLSSKEPDTCLWTLNVMEKLIPVDSVEGTWFGRVGRAIHAEVKLVSEAIKLFDEGADIFYFLLTPEVWNSKKGVHASSETSLDMDSRIDRPDPSRVRSQIRRKELRSPLVPPAKMDGIDKVLLARTLSKSRRNFTKIDSLLQWFDGLTCDEKYGDFLKMRQPGTCKWLLETSQYNKWKNGQDLFLWLQGKPGAGKTVLATSVIETIKQALQDGEHMAFFYCDFRSEQTTSAAGVMRSILSQLLHKLRDSQGNGPDLRQLVDDLVKEKSEDASILKHADRIAPFVSRTATQLDQQPFVVIDALDECQDLESLLSALRELTACGGIRLFVTSRPLQIIKDNLHGLPFISTDRMAKEVSADIELHVTKEVEGDRRLRILEEKLKMEICETLQREADGMFRWVQCQIDTLKKCPTARDIRNALKNLPDGLEETYERILRGMDPPSPEGQVAMRALVWLVAASRSLCLVEIIDALSIDLKARRLDRGLAPVHGPALLDVVGSLVVYNEETDIVNLSHFTVKEYLVGSLIQVKLPWHHINLQVAQVEVLRLCMGYIAALIRHPQLSDVVNIQCTDKQRRIPTPDPFPLLNYVLLHGFDHLKHLGSVIPPILDDVVTLRLDIHEHPTEWAQVCKLVRSSISSFKWLSPEHDFVIYVVISLLPAPSLHTFLCRASFKAFDQTSPLVYATHLGKIEQARTLLSWGIKVHRAGWDVGSARKLLPLEVAFYGRHHSLFELFLKHWRAPIPSRLFSALFGAQEWWGCYPSMILQILKCDEFAEWAIEGQYQKILLSPSNLSNILIYGEEDIIAILQRFLQVGCDLSLPESLSSTLQVTWDAVSKFRPRLLEFLYSQNVPIPSRVFSGGVLLETRMRSLGFIRILKLERRRRSMKKLTRLVQKLVSHGHDLGTIVTNGDLEFKRVLCSIFLKFTPCKQRFPMDLLIVGRTGAGKNTLIDVITSAPDGLPSAIQLYDGSRDSTQKPISYAAFLQECPLQIWDTPGFDKTSDTEQIKSSINKWIQHISSNQIHSEHGQDKPNHDLMSPIIQVVWCMHASDIDDPDVWQQFCAVYAECHSRRILPLLVLNQITSMEPPTRLEMACKVKLRQLDLPAPAILPRFLMGVRSYQDSSSCGYKEGCQTLREVIYCYVRDLQVGALFFRASRSTNRGQDPEWPEQPAL